MSERQTAADFWLVFGLFIFCSNGAQCSNPLTVVVGHGSAEVTLPLRLSLRKNGTSHLPVRSLTVGNRRRGGTRAHISYHPDCFERGRSCAASRNRKRAGSNSYCHERPRSRSRPSSWMDAGPSLWLAQPTMPRSWSLRRPVTTTTINCFWLAHTKQESG